MARSILRGSYAIEKVCALDLFCCIELCVIGTMRLFREFILQARAKSLCDTGK